MTFYSPPPPPFVLLPLQKYPMWLWNCTSAKVSQPLCSSGGSICWPLFYRYQQSQPGLALPLPARGNPSLLQLTLACSNVAIAAVPLVCGATWDGILQTQTSSTVRVDCTPGRQTNPLPRHLQLPLHGAGSGVGSLLVCVHGHRKAIQLLAGLKWCWKH